MSKHKTERRGDNEYLGLPRTEWVTQAARALISTHSPALRFLIIKAGFVHFQNKVIPAFDHEVNIKFTSSEARKMFEALVWWANKKGEVRFIWPTLEKAYASMRRGEKWKASTLREQSEMLVTIDTENANGRRMVH